MEQPEKLTGTLKEQLDSITPALQEMQMRKEERVRQFREVQTEIQKIASEIAGRSVCETVAVNEGDLSLKKLEDYHNELQRLKKEKVIFNKFYNIGMQHISYDHSFSFSFSLFIHVFFNLIE